MTKGLPQNLICSLQGRQAKKQKRLEPRREHILSFKHKYTYEEKVRIVQEYESKTYGFNELCRIYGMAATALKDWIRLYETFGFEGLKTRSTITHYTKETKEAAVREYLEHKITIKEVLKKYQIRSYTQLRKWIKKYNGHEALREFETGGHRIMTDGRKTTYDERVEIVQYCIAHGHNYAETAQRYKVSYQQAYSYTKKYEAGGVEALVDRRGKPKPEEKMTELDRLRAENRILKAEKERAQAELSFLKKLEKIERRRG